MQIFQIGYLIEEKHLNFIWIKRTKLGMINGQWHKKENLPNFSTQVNFLRCSFYYLTIENKIKKCPSDFSTDTDRLEDNWETNNIRSLFITTKTFWLKVVLK